MVPISLVAATLRPPLTAVGPVLPQIGSDFGIGEGLQGLLGALPLLAFAAISPIVHRISGRTGPEWAVVLSLSTLAIGAVVRSYGGLPGLWIGTAVLGSAIAVGNVLLSTLVRRDHAERLTFATAVYTTVIGLTAAPASAVAVPLSSVIGWQGALAVWAIPALVVALIWLPRARSGRDAPKSTVVVASSPTAPIWKQAAAWQATVYLGLLSTTFYVVVTWLPTIEASFGTSAERAGFLLFLFQVVGIGSGVIVPRLFALPRGDVVAPTASSVIMFIGMVGLIIAPGVSVVWIPIIGFGIGIGFVTALSLIVLTARTHSEATRLSGMAQSVGYLMAAAGPVLAGVLASITGSWTVTLVVVALVIVMQAAVALARIDRRFAVLSS